MTPKMFKLAGLAACVGALTVAWLLTDALGGWVILPLLASLTAAGLLIANDGRAPTVAILAGIAQAAHAVQLLAWGAALRHCRQSISLAPLAC